MTPPRLIERAFPLKQTSLDSVHEKNVRHGHISTLHIWPARRPLAACRAALLATLLPDPATPDERRKLVERIGGKLTEKVVTKKEPGGRSSDSVKEETTGGVLHWGRENSPDMDWFREQIRAAFGGRAPRVLDPFAGGGAIPLEAMRLGCEVTAVDINPVAWFILKCTLEYPQRLAGQTRPLPDFYTSRQDGANRTECKGQASFAASEGEAGEEGDLADHVRAWGWWVLEQSRTDLERFYPTVAGKPTVASTCGCGRCAARTAAPRCPCSRRAGWRRSLASAYRSRWSRTPSAPGLSSGWKTTRRGRAAMASSAAPATPPSGRGQ
jgi:adenine-specific DNA methylase